MLRRNARKRSDGPSVVLQGADAGPRDSRVALRRTGTGAIAHTLVGLFGLSRWLPGHLPEPFQDDSETVRPLLLETAELP